MSTDAKRVRALLANVKFLALFNMHSQPHQPQYQFYATVVTLKQKTITAYKTRIEQQTYS